MATQEPEALPSGGEQLMEVFETATMPDHFQPYNNIVPPSHDDVLSGLNALDAKLTLVAEAQHDILTAVRTKTDVPAPPPRTTSFRDNTDFQAIEQTYIENTNALQQRIAILESQNASLIDSNDTLKRETAAQKDKLANLQKIIARAGRNDDMPMDGDIRAQFVNLKSSIQALAMNHYSKFAVKQLPQDVSPDYLILRVREKIADALYEEFFAPTVLLYGYERDEGPNAFKKVEERLRAGNGSDNDLRDWRVLTLRLVSSLPDSGKEVVPDIIADRLSAHLERNCHHRSYAKSEREQALRDLRAVCAAAYELALLFRSQRVEYMWEQRTMPPTRAVSDKEHEVIGTEGLTEGEDVLVQDIVFGGVVRGDRTTGRLKDGRSRIMKSSIIIVANPKPGAYAM